MVKCYAGKVKDAALSTEGPINQAVPVALGRLILATALMAKWFAYIMVIMKGSRNPKLLLALLRPFQ